MNTHVRFYTFNEQTGYAEFYMPKVGAVASTWGGITFPLPPPGAQTVPRQFGLP